MAKTLTLVQVSDFDDKLKAFNKLVVEYNNIQHSLRSDLKVDKIKVLRENLDQISNNTASNLNHVLNQLLEIHLNVKRFELDEASKSISDKFDINIDYAKSLNIKDDIPLT